MSEGPVTVVNERKLFTHIGSHDVESALCVPSDRAWITGQGTWAIFRPQGGQELKLNWRAVYTTDFGRLPAGCCYCETSKQQESRDHSD